MYIVRSLDLTNWLCGQGYRILKVEDSEKNPKYKVFLFEDTKQIRNSVTEYLSKRCSLIDQWQQKKNMGIRYYW